MILLHTYDRSVKMTLDKTDTRKTMVHTRQVPGKKSANTVSVVLAYTFVHAQLWILSQHILLTQPTLSASKGLNGTDLDTEPLIPILPLLH